MNFIPYSCQVIEEDDIKCVVDALKSTHLTQGPLVADFEKAIENSCSAKYAVALSSGTAALHLGMLALGIKEGSLVWTTPITFVATANAALYCGADVDFVDIDPITANICINSLEQKLELASKAGKLPALLAVVHFAGNPVDIIKIKRLSDKYGFKILEDAAHAYGATYLDGSNVGNCHNSDLTILSFHAVKSITTAEGGAC
jgi:dTDP-4-amino-4,6-dideoxygalactose transaminase